MWEGEIIVFRGPDGHMWVSTGTQVFPTLPTDTRYFKAKGPSTPFPLVEADAMRVDDADRWLEDWRRGGFDFIEVDSEGNSI